MDPTATATTAATTQQLSRFGTVTPKDFLFVAEPRALELIPTGVWKFKRVPLYLLLPQLGKIPLSVYYRLRIACCGALLTNGPDKLLNCDRCRHNCGYVCPRCLSATWVKDDEGKLMRCPACCYEYLDEKGKIVSAYDEQREQIAVNRWLALRFPMGVPGALAAFEADTERWDTA